MKICFILEHFYPHVGGVETVFFEYAKRLSEKNIQIKVVTSNSGGITGYKKIDNFEVFHLDVPSFFGHPILSTKEITPFVEWADIVHTTTYTAALPSIKLCRKLKKPCVITVHEALGKKWLSIEKNIIKGLIFFIFEWFVITRNYDYFHAVSLATKKDLEKYNIDKDKIEVIYNGIDEQKWNNQIEKKNLAKYLGFSEDDLIFLFSGRPGKTKGLFVLLDAIKKINTEIEGKCKFGFMLSNDPLREKLKFIELVNKYNLNNLIKIAPPVNIRDLPRYRKSAFAVIIPSITEGFGFNAAETIALGVPVIASDAGSLLEIMSGKFLLFENKNSEDLSKKIILATKGKFENCIEKKFSWNDSVEKLLLLYKKIIEKNE
jgi:glycosyltransferase involved in cell wall biosynthesis